MKIGVLGPEGSFTDEVSDYVDGDKVYYQDIVSMLKAVREGKVDAAVVPFENSLQGTVISSLDGLNEYSLFANRSLIKHIHHCIAAISKEAKHSVIMSHPQAIAQCRKYIEKHFPDLSIVNTNSTSEAFLLIRKENKLDAMAIGSKKAAEVYNFEIIDENIEDTKNNATKFLVVSKKVECSPDANKSLIVISPHKDEQGLLLSILKFFDEGGINLTKIESRPSRKELGTYIFYIEFDGSIKDSNVKEVLSNLRSNVGDIKVLGCYKDERID